MASAVQLLMSALVAALTVGGKAIGKGFAIGASKEIVHDCIHGDLPCQSRSLASIKTNRVIEGIDCEL